MVGNMSCAVFIGSTVLLSSLVFECGGEEIIIMTVICNPLASIEAHIDIQHSGNHVNHQFVSVGG